MNTLTAGMPVSLPLRFRPGEANAAARCDHNIRAGSVCSRCRDRRTLDRVPADETVERTGDGARDISTRDMAAPIVIDPADLPEPDEADIGDLEFSVDRPGSTSREEPGTPENAPPRGPGTLVPLDFPDRLVKRGLQVAVIKGWETRGKPADHRAGVLHHTASNLKTTPKATVAGHLQGKPDVSGPLCNVTIGRDGVVYVLARLASNNAGKISPVAFEEACAGKADLTPAAKRKLHDSGGENSHLFGIECCNDGVGEPWSDEMVNNAAVVAAVVCECLGWTEKRWTTHRALTERKIDPSFEGDWHAEIRSRLGGAKKNGGAIVSTLPVVQPASKAGPLPGVGNRFAFFTHDDNRIIGWNSAAISGDKAATTDAESVSGKSFRFIKVPVSAPAKLIGISYGTQSNGEIDHNTIVAYSSDGATFAFQSV